MQVRYFLEPDQNKTITSVENNGGGKSLKTEEGKGRRESSDLIFLGLERRGDKSQILNDFLGVFSFSCSGFTTEKSQNSP